MNRWLTSLLIVPGGLLAQPSTVVFTPNPDGTKTVKIQNIAFYVNGTRLLRKTTQSKQILTEKGMEGSVTLEVWPLGADTKLKPLYTIKATGTDGQIIDSSLFVISRGLEETEWWSVYKLSDGKRLFDTYVPLLTFPVGRLTLQTRYVGLEIPPDDTKDPRLKQPNVIGVLTYATEDRVMGERLLTCDDPKRAQLLRSYADVTRKLTFNERQGLTLSFRENFPSPPNPVDIVIPTTNDGLDAAHAQLPPAFHLTAWKR